MERFFVSSLGIFQKVIFCLIFIYEFSEPTLAPEPMNSACFYINIYIENIKLLYQPRWQNYLYYSFSCFSEKIFSIA